MPMPASSFERSCPAAPTKGTPCLSSWKPGASPTNIRSADGEPLPKTTWVRPSARRFSSAAATRPAATATTAEAGLSGGAVCGERRAELLRDLGVPAVGARGIRIGHPDELLEVGLAAHADVVVDRHQTDPSTGMLTNVADYTTLAP